MPARPKLTDASKTGVQSSARSRANRTVMAVDGKLAPQPPVGLTKEARAAWEMAVSCAPDGLLTALDHSILERWCRNYALYKRLSRDVEENGTVSEVEGLETIRPSFTALMKVQAAIAQCEKELGFSPVSRARVSIKQEESTTNAFADI